MRSDRLFLILAAWAGCAMISTTVQAAPFAVHETAGGADTPFTTLQDDLPALWDIYIRPAVTHPTADRWLFFPEPSLNNHSSIPFGQILRAQSQSGREYWVIWDMLAWVPAPHPLFLFTRHPVLDSWSPVPDHQLAFPLESGLFVLGGNELAVHEEGHIIPMPTAAAVWLLLLALPWRRMLRRHARPAVA